MPGPYTLEKIENWASDFCLLDELRLFSRRSARRRDHCWSPF